MVVVRARELLPETGAALAGVELIAIMENHARVKYVRSGFVPCRAKSGDVDFQQQLNSNHLSVDGKCNLSVLIQQCTNETTATP